MSHTDPIAARLQFPANFCGILRARDEIKEARREMDLQDNGGPLYAMQLIETTAFFILLPFS